MANGLRDFLNDVDALIVPGDLLAALEAGQERPFWDATPRSVWRGRWNGSRPRKPSPPGTPGSPKW